MQDVYDPDRQISEATAEHILLNSLGGRWRVAGLVDRSTNSLLGHSIDAALHDDLIIFRTLLDASSGDGRSAPIFKKALGADGKRYDLLPTGKPQLADLDFRIRSEDGALHIGGTVRSLAEARRLSRRPFKKHNIPLDRLDELTVEQTTTCAPSIKLHADLTEAGRRAIAKMACNLFAAHHRDLFVTPAFDNVRRFVTDGAGVHAAVCGPVDVGRGMGDFDHLILVVGNAATGEVGGLVSLYGRLQFVVDLASSATLPADFRASYRVDPVGRAERRNDERDLLLDVPVFAADDGPHGAVWMAAMSDLFRAAYRHSQIAQAIDRCWSETFKDKPDGEEITAQEMAAFSNAVVNALIPRFYRVRIEDRAQDV